MSGDGAGLSLDWARQRTCARERWGRENPQRTAPGEALVFRQWTRVRFPPPPPPDSLPRVQRPARSRIGGAGPSSWLPRSAVVLARAEREDQSPEEAAASTARPASSRATGTRNGEHDT